MRNDPDFKSFLDEMLDGRLATRGVTQPIQTDSEKHHSRPRDKNKTAKGGKSSKIQNVENVDVETVNTTQEVEEV